MGESGPRFLCDEMLGRLARYLRAAGYDTLLAEGGAPDRLWLDLARTQGRLLLSCDRRLLQHRAAAGVVVPLAQDGLDRQAAELRQRCGVDWLWRPFSRCLVDNTELLAASDAPPRRVGPPAGVAELRFCPSCGRIYWPGSHHRRMRARLAAWRDGASR